MSGPSGAGSAASADTNVAGGVMGAIIGLALLTMNIVLLIVILRTRSGKQHST